MQHITFHNPTHLIPSGWFTPAPLDFSVRIMSLSFGILGSDPVVFEHDCCIEVYSDKGLKRSIS